MDKNERKKVLARLSLDLDRLTGKGYVLRFCKPVVEIETGRVFISIGHAANETGYTYGGLRLLLKNTHKAKKTGLHYCLKSAWDRIPNKI